MEIWIEQEKNKLRLPVLPSSISVSNSFQNKSVNIVEFGEVNIIGNKSCTGVSFSSIFPAQCYGFCQYMDVPKPYELVNQILAFMDEPINLIITDTNINMRATIESFTNSEEDGTGDVSYSIDFKRYRAPKLKTKTKKTVSKKGTKVDIKRSSRSTKSVKTTTYTVKSGDTLSKIAKKVTGDSANYRAIANQNKIKDVNAIKAGQKLVIKI